MQLNHQAGGVVASRVSGPESLQLHTVNDVCRALRIGRTTVHALINEGRLLRVKIGRATRITNSSLLQYIERASAKGGQSDVG